MVLELERPADQQGLHLFQVGKNASLFGNAPAHSASDARMLFQAADDLERFMTEDVLKSVQVITGTLVGASNRNIRQLTFETVCIDEAADAGVVAP